MTVIETVVNYNLQEYEKEYKDMLGKDVPFANLDRLIKAQVDKIQIDFAKKKATFRLAELKNMLEGSETK